jgi:hypothetical protein
VQTPKRSSAWIWIFILLAVASIVVATVMVRYNQGLQLTREKLQTARALWQEHGPRDYDMVYTKQLGNDPRTERFAVKVRSGVVVEALMNGMPLEKENLPYHSMDVLFSFIGQFLDQDSKPGRPRIYTRGVFDEQNGAIREYTRRVLGANPERTYLKVELKKVEPR